MRTLGLELLLYLQPSIVYGLDLAQQAYEEGREGLLETIGNHFSTDSEAKEREKAEVKVKVSHAHDLGRLSR